MLELKISTILQSILSLILVFFLNITANAKYSGGTGEPNDPYQIGNAEDLIALGNEPNDYDKNFILIDDVNLAGYVFDKAVISPTYSRVGVTLFTGVFDGNNHTISNLNIQGHYSYQGLFGCIMNATIKNLGLIDIIYNSVGYCIGGLAGLSINSIITNCYVTGTINCSNKGGASIVGGFIGSKFDGLVNKSYFIGTVSGIDYVGGLIGEQTGSLIHCYSTATVSGHSTVGGLVGVNGGTSIVQSSKDGEIAQSYSTGEVTGHDNIGGLVGYNKKGYITQCYSSGKVSGNPNNFNYIGGMIGRNDNDIISKSFWDIETSGLSASAAGIGKTTSEMYDPNMFINSGWDFVGEIQNGTNEVWQIPQGGGYPELSFFNGYVPPQLTGHGTHDDPYLISDANELGAMIHYNSDAHYKLSNSIDLSGITWNTAIIPYFDGNFDGNKLTISNMSIEGTCFVGLFGTAYSKAQIRNTGIIDVNIICLGDNTGGLVGCNYGTLTQCYVSGKMRNNHCIGGLAGYNEGNINNCYSHSTVDSNNLAGGLIGCNKFYGSIGSIDKCYSTGKVTSTQSFAGGLIGGTQYSIKPIINCFWDIQTSGCTRGDRGKGLKTSQMQTKSTFTDAGWDFVGETNNGTDDIWSICEGTNYPRFVWQIPKGDFLCPDGISFEDDFDFFFSHWGNSNCDQSNGYCDGTDLDLSGIVDIYDFEIIINNWLKENL